jgi:hypothetical protein
MHTVLRTTAGRVSIALALSAGTAGVLAAPAWASAHSASGHPASAQHARGQAGSDDVEIGTAVSYVREPDGTIRQVQ